MRNVLKNWDAMRLLRLALGVFIIVQGVMDKQWMFVFMGGLFTLMPIFNVGCCSAGSCNTYRSQDEFDAEKVVVFEEVKGK